MTGTPSTTLVVLRGNSGSGKTSVARALKDRRGLDELAVISQDVVRRDILRTRDLPGNPAIALIDLMARHALDQGLSVIIEGILYPDRYAPLLTALAADHVGATRAYRWDLAFEETLRRHAMRGKAAEFGEEEMRSWWCGRAPIEELDEQVIGPEVSLYEAVRRIESDCGWTA